jgi:hypothetical protein
MIERRSRVGSETTGGLEVECCGGGGRRRRRGPGNSQPSQGSSEDRDPHCLKWALSLLLILFYFIGTAER